MLYLELLKIFDPYIPIAFLLVSLYIFYRLCRNHYLLYRQLQDIKLNHPFSNTRDEYFNIAKLKNIFILIILAIEIAINLIGSVGWLIVNIESHNLPTSINLSDNCIIYENRNLVALGYWKGWFLYLLTRIVEVISLSLLPTICCALNVMRCCYLSHPYKKSVKFWKYFIGVRSILLLILSNTIFTFVLYYISQIILFWLDLIVYLIYAVRLKLVLRSIRNAALIQHVSSTSRKTIISTKTNYDECRKSVKVFSITTFFTFILEFVLILQVTINGIILLVTTLVVNSCYFSYITLGYLHIDFTAASLEKIDHFRSHAYVLSFSLSYFHQFLMFIAYIAFFRLSFQRVNLKQLEKKIRNMLDNTYYNHE